MCLEYTKVMLIKITPRKRLKYPTLRHRLMKSLKPHLNANDGAGAGVQGVHLRGDVGAVKTLEYTVQ